MWAFHRTNDSDRFITWHLVRNVLIKAVAMFVVLNLLYAIVEPLPLIGRISLYNLFFPGRLRLPYGSDPERSFNLTISQLDAMFASHEIDGAKKTGSEYRVLLLGDSSVWGFLLEPDQTLSSKLNEANLHTRDGRRIRAYNLGYPTMSVTKDLLILEYSLRYQPDLILWLVTLESLPYWEQLESPVVQFNSEETSEAIHHYQLKLDPQDERLESPTFLSRTIVGERKQLADIIRLQLYGVLWTSTQIDRHLPETSTQIMKDLPDDETFGELEQGEMTINDLAFEVIGAGLEVAGNVPVLLINEPIFISQGVNSEIRYNVYYPRWAYDEYRHLLLNQSQASGWSLIDLWNVLSPSEFSDSAVHFSSTGAAKLAQLLGEAILEQANRIP